MADEQQMPNEGGVESPVSQSGGVPPSDTTIPAQGEAATPASPPPGNTDPTILGTAETESVQGAPEAYEPFKDPYGKSVDASAYEDFSASARELNLSQEAAQKMWSSMYPAADKYVRALAKQNVVSWTESCKTDKEFGGDNFKASMGVASKAYKAYATPELKQMLDASGLGSHPEIVRLFYRIGKTLSQDTGVGGQRGAPSAPQRMFPNSNMVV